MGKKKRRCRDCGGTPIFVEMDDGRSGYWCEFCEDIEGAEPLEGRIVNRYRTLAQLFAVRE